MTDIAKDWAGHLFASSGYCVRCKMNFQRWINAQGPCKGDEREVKVERGGERE